MKEIPAVQHISPDNATTFESFRRQRPPRSSGGRRNFMGYSRTTWRTWQNNAKLL